MRGNKTDAKGAKMKIKFGHKFGHKNSTPIVDCEYYWSDWSNCSVSCGKGETTRKIVITAKTKNQSLLVVC